MEQVTRLFLWFLFAGIALTIATSVIVWWYDDARRLGRALTSSLMKVPDAFIYDVSGTKACGMDFTAGDLCVLWQTGQSGLVFGFEEIDGCELIVDERVVGRAQRGEARRVLDETFHQASRVTLRLLFNHVEMPEFEITLFGEISRNRELPKTSAEAVKIGRKWLSHVDAVIKRQSSPANSPYPQAKTAVKSTQGHQDDKSAPSTAPQPPASHVPKDTLSQELPF